MYKDTAPLANLEFSETCLPISVSFCPLCQSVLISHQKACFTAHGSSEHFNYIINTDERPGFNKAALKCK